MSTENKPEMEIHYEEDYPGYGPVWVILLVENGYQICGEWVRKTKSAAKTLAKAKAKIHGAKRITINYLPEIIEL
jgi:hypothetical protein